MVAGMIASHAEEHPPGRHPLARGASPRDVRAALLPEDRGAFDQAYAAALDAARENLELTELFEVLEGWRRIAALQRDPERFRTIVRRVAELRGGEPVPADEPLVVTRGKAGL